MYFRNVCTAVMIITLCSPLATKASRKDELTAAVTQARQALDKATKNAQAYFERNNIEYDAALEFQKKAEYAFLEAHKNLQSFEISMLAFSLIDVVSVKAYNENTDDEGTDDEHIDDNKSDDRLPTNITVEDVTATLTFDDGNETSLVGALKIYNDDKTMPQNCLVYFAGKPTDF